MIAESLAIMRLKPLEGDLLKTYLSGKAALVIGICEDGVAIVD
jgi:hypothetical protein